MSQFDSNKDYYGVLGVDKEASQVEIERQYKRAASKHHPDRGGSEERMKSLNEAYGVLKDQTRRSSYDATRRRPDVSRQGFTPVTTPTARDVGVLGHCLSAGLCLIAGIFLLLLVRSEEHTSELQSQFHLVCRLLLEKKKECLQPRCRTCPGSHVRPAPVDHRRFDHRARAPHCRRQLPRQPPHATRTPFTPALLQTPP